MKYLYVLIIGILAIIHVSCNQKTNIIKSLIIPSNKSDYFFEVTGDLKVDIIKTNKEKSAFQLSCDGMHQAPSITIHSKNNLWRLSGYRYLVTDITNTGKEPVLVEMRLNANGWLKQAKVVQPGETRAIKSVIIQNEIPAYYKEKIIGMYNLPDGVIMSSSSTDSIQKISFLVICPQKETKILISNIHLEQIISYPTEKELSTDYYPILDEFGQYLHTEWPGKISCLEDLKRSVETEATDIETNPKPLEWNRFGGLTNGPKFEATDHFRTQKVDGKWWLIDPDGRLFWSHGIGSVGAGGGSSVITDREFYFSTLPDSNQYLSFYSKRRWAPFGYYKNRETKTFDQIGWNMMNKYGDDWKKEGEMKASMRLWSWCQNTIGAWSSSEIYLNSNIPYTPIVMSNPRRIEGSEGHWYKFPDPYDKDFILSLKNRIKAIEKSTDDPYCIGYFVDNELSWGDSTSIAQWTISSPVDQPAKVVMLDFLKQKYRDISNLNKSWNTDFYSWDDFMQNASPDKLIESDAKDFTLKVIHEYFQKVRSVLKELAPNKLYLGPRLDFHFYPSEKSLNNWDFRNNWIVNIAAQYCDVVSFNRYRHSAKDLRPGDFDKPVIIGEWHHVPLEKSSFYLDSDHYIQSLNLRAEKYEDFINSCLDNPFIVGAHYFQYYDQPTVGRADGENFSCGFLNICDRPYEEMVAVSRRVGHNIYTTRQKMKDYE